MKNPRFLWFLSPFLLLGGCAAGPSWKEVGFPSPLQKGDAWFLAGAAAKAAGFSMDERISDPDEGEMVSLWKERLAPFGKGYRLKLHLRFLPPGERTVKGLEFYVERQVNQSMEHQFSPQPEDWGDGGQDPEAEALFETHLATRIRQIFSPRWKKGEKPPKKGVFPGR